MRLRVLYCIAPLPVVMASAALAAKAADNATAVGAQGTVTGWIMTGPRVGSSSVAWETPGGVMMSMAFGTADGGTEQMDAVPPGVHTPNVNGPAGWVKPRA